MDLDEQAELEGLYTISLQPVEVWGQKPDMDLRDATRLDVYQYEEPTKADIITACGCRLDCRYDIFVWQAQQSDVSGCVELHSKELLASKKTDLFERNTPVLCLLDALHNQGFSGVSQAVVHGDASGRLFDSRGIASRRAYLQCVLAISKLFANGITEFRSVGSQAYFEALLRGKGLVQSGLPAVEYKKLLAAEREDFGALAALGDGGAANKSRALPKPQVGEQPQSQQQQPKPLEDCAMEEDDSSIAGGSNDSGNEDGEIVGAGADLALQDAPEQQPVGGEGENQEASGLPPGFAREIQGMRVGFVAGRATASHTYADRAIVRCCNPEHQRCGKSRSLALQRDRFGLRSAEFYLAAWMSKAYEMDANNHSKYQPKVADIEAFLGAQP